MLEFVRAVIDSFSSFEDRFVLEGDVPQDVRDIYTETHYAFALMLLFLLDGGDRRRLDRAALRLEKWAELRTETPFNNFIVCLALYVFRRERIDHPRLERVLHGLCVRQSLSPKQLYAQRCGNNMYIKHLVTAVVIRPLALARPVAAAEVDDLLLQLGAFRSAEGFYFDEPRRPGTPGERRFPLAYILMHLFLIGICRMLLEDHRFGELFVAGMRAVLPLMTGTGGFSYFGRSDNTTFAAGLAIFNLRLLLHLDPAPAGEWARLLEAQERAYRATPRTAGGWLEVNAFRAAAGDTEPGDPGVRWSRDTYTYPTEYSVASCCYVLLGRLWCPGEIPRPPGEAAARAAWSEDLRIARLGNRAAEAFIFTGSQPECRDRRYLGPSVLLFGVGGGAPLIGAVPRMCSRDFENWRRRGALRGSPAGLLWYRWRHGLEGYDARFAGFIPVFRRGRSIYLPGPAAAASASGDSVASRHAFLEIPYRGLPVALGELRDLARKNLLQGSGRPLPPPFRSYPLTLERTVRLSGGTLEIEDRISGECPARTCEIAVRHSAGAAVSVTGLARTGRHAGWSSDGPCDIDLYSVPVTGAAVSYTIRVG